MLIETRPELDNQPLASIVRVIPRCAVHIHVTTHLNLTGMAHPLTEEHLNCLRPSARPTRPRPSATLGDYTYHGARVDIPVFHH